MHLILRYELQIIIIWSSMKVDQILKKMMILKHTTPNSHTIHFMDNTKARKTIQVLKVFTSTICGKENETILATYKTTLEYVSTTWFLLCTHSIDPCLWGESDHPAFGPQTSVSPSGQQLHHFRGVCLQIQG